MRTTNKKNLRFWITACSILLVVIAGLTSCTTGSDNDKPGPFSFLKDHPEIDHVLDSLVDGEHIPFVYARIEGADGSLIYEHTKVNKALYPELELSGDSWFRVWSMSKIVTISMAMDLVEEGKLALSDPVAKYIPEFSDMKVAETEKGTPITDLKWENRAEACPIRIVPAETVMTVEDLIHHKAGFFYPWTGMECLDSIWQQFDLNAAQNAQELINRLKEMPLVQHPGNAYFYGLNTTVLGLVLERATGTGLRELVKERITEPMNIQGLQYSQSADVLLLPRTRGGEALENIHAGNQHEIFGANLPDYDPEIPMYLGGEGMLATTDAYADFMRMLMHSGTLNGYRYLDEATIEEMSAPHTQLDNPWGNNGYNLWVTSDTLESLEIGEAGLWVSGGYEGTYSWIDHERQIVGLVMTQMFNMQAAPSEVFRGAVYRTLWKNEK